MKKVRRRFSTISLAIMLKGCCGLRFASTGAGVVLEDSNSVSSIVAITQYLEKLYVSGRGSATIVVICSRFSNEWKSEIGDRRLEINSGTRRSTVRDVELRREVGNGI